MLGHGLLSGRDITHARCLGEASHKPTLDVCLEKLAEVMCPSPLDPAALSANPLLPAPHPHLKNDRGSLNNCVGSVSTFVSHKHARTCSRQDAHEY